MKTSFRQKCGSALTHPLTIGAILTLLLNDLALKSLWPDYWITGKLSDLAWVVFSPPLLAFLLSHFCRRNPFAERGALAVAYIGFPLLYAAFNTFGLLHDWILRVLLPFTNSTVGSPLDPTDSIVIPFGLSLALWIWKRDAVGSESIRARLVLFTAVVASIAALASSPGERSPTEWLGGIGDDGYVVIEGPSREHYKSYDGGLTWDKARTGQGLITEWGGDEVETPRGAYFIQGSNIILRLPSGDTKEVYSTAYLKKSSNVWAQRYDTRRLRSGITDLYEDAEEFVAAEPFNIIYDERTDNVIVAMGLQGALIGAPDETWKRVAVGRFAPTDFSFSGKAHLMFSSGSFWLATVAFTLSFFVLTLALTEVWEPSTKSASGLARVFRWGLGILLLLLLMVSAMTVNLYVLFIAIILLPLVLIALTRTLPREGLLRRCIAGLFALLAIGFSASGFPPFGGGAPGFVDTETLWAAAALAFAVSAVAILPPRAEWLTSSAVALATMNTVVVLMYMLWLTGGLILALATLASFVLIALTAFMLRRHLTRQTS